MKKVEEKIEVEVEETRKRIKQEEEKKGDNKRRNGSK
jgi:hypothetical protein